MNRIPMMDLKCKQSASINLKINLKRPDLCSKPPNKFNGIVRGHSASIQLYDYQRIGNECTANNAHILLKVAFVSLPVCTQPSNSTIGEIFIQSSVASEKNLFSMHFGWNETFFFFGQQISSCTKTS